MATLSLATFVNISMTDLIKNVTNINIAERHFLGRGVSAINGIVG